MPRYVILHKPYGVLSQFSGGDPGQALRGWVPLPGIYPVGRLDKDSEGLLLLTDDGPLAHRLSDPRYEHPKTYWVQIEGLPTPEALRQLCEGVMLEGRLTRPAVFEPMDEPQGWPERSKPIRFRRAIPTSWLRVVLREGRNRQIRRMTAAVGLPTLRLIRVALGPLQLADLPVGAWRELAADEVAQLKALSAGARPASRGARRPGRSRPRAR